MPQRPGTRRRPADVHAWSSPASGHCPTRGKARTRPLCGSCGYARRGVPAELGNHPAGVFVGVLMIQPLGVVNIIFVTASMASQQHSVARHTVSSPRFRWAATVFNPADASPDFRALRLRLSKLRVERSLTYDQLAERSGVSRATLVVIETGSHRSRRPNSPSSRGSLESWWRIARALDVPLADLLDALG
jgi:DNA-binding XRE family transcriptional regulator